MDKLTSEQAEYVYKHLRDPQKSFAICAIARKLVENNKEIHLDVEETELAALLMNIGETSEKISINGVSIYSKEYGPWDDKAKELNFIRGRLSVEMAEEQGITLSENAKEAIISTSRGGSLNKLAITLKLAQTMEAIRHPRWSRSEQKQPAKDLKEVTEILAEELDYMLKGQDIDDITKAKIKESMLSAAKVTYLQKMHMDIQRLVQGVTFAAESEMEQKVVNDSTTKALTEARISALLENMPEEKIDEFYSKLQVVNDNDTYTAIRKEDVMCRIVSEWEQQSIDKKVDRPEDI